MQQAGDQEEAREVFEVVLKYLPHRAVAVLNLADTEHALEDIARARLHYRQYLALTKEEQRRLLRTAEHTRRPKDRAIVTLMLYTGIRISECAALNLDDVYAQGRKRRVTVRSGKGDKYRVVPLNGTACESLQAWLQERAQKFAGQKTDEAFFLNPQGGRMTTAALDLIVRKVGQEAGLEISAHILRHTLLTNLVRQGNDLVLVAEIGGHKRLETTRRYSLPSSEDKKKAMAALSD